MFNATLKSLLTHKLRLALTALAIILGVSFVAGTYVLTDTMTATFDELFDDAATGVDVSVRSTESFDQSREPLPESLVGEIAEVEGVQAVEGSLLGFAQIVDKVGEAIAPMGPPTLGAGWGRYEEMSALTLREGDPPRSPDEVVIDAGTARKYEFEVGDRVEVMFRGPAHEFELVGIAGFGEHDNLAGATLAVFEMETAQELMDRRGEFDSIDILAEEGVSARELSARVAAVVGEDYSVVTASQLADEQAAEIEEGLSFFSIAMLSFAAIALFVGSFIIANTFSIIVAQRTRELALLRAVGATRRQVLRSILTEAALTGVAGSILGVGAGVLVAIGLRSLLNSFGAELPGGGIVITGKAVIVPIIVGVTVTVVASIVPARRATKVPPVAALRDDFALPSDVSHKRTILGLILLPIGMGILMFGLLGRPGNAAAVVGIGALAIFLAVSSLAPVAANPVARILGAPISRIFGISGRLARDNSMRNPRRTASTAAALMIGLALVAFVSVFASSIKESASNLFRAMTTFDYAISTSNFQGLDPDVAERIATAPGVATATSFRNGNVKIEGAETYVSAVDFSRFAEVVRVELVGGSSEEAGSGALLVEESVAEDEGWSVGSGVTIEFPNGLTRAVTIAGIYERNPLAGGYLLSQEDWAAGVRDQVDSMIFVNGDPSVEASEVRSSIEQAVADVPGTEIRNTQELLAHQEEQVDQTLVMLTALLGLALIIAFIGIINTLALSVLERTREIGLLRAIGMSRRQLRRMVRWESVIVAVLGALLGVAVGIFFGWAMVLALSDEGVTELVIPGGTLAAYVVVAGVAGIAAAVFPARRAARLDVLKAITLE